MTIDPDTQRNGDWIQTYTGRAFHYDDFTADDIVIEDIAHALAMECRYGGHTAWHYSVAQHSVHVYDWLRGQGHPKMTCQQGLLHDAPEAYLKDIMRPLKIYLGTRYGTLNGLIWGAICNKYQIDYDMELIVKKTDLCLALTERDQLLSHCKRPWAPMPAEFVPLPITIPEWSPARAKAEFMKRFRFEFGAYAV